MLGGILQRVGHEYLAANRLYSKRSVTRGQRGIGERPGERDQVEVAVEHIDLSTIEVGSQKERSRGIGNHGQALINGARRRTIDGKNGIARVVPARDGSVFTIKEKLTGKASDLEAAGLVDNGAQWELRARRRREEPESERKNGDCETPLAS